MRTEVELIFCLGICVWIAQEFGGMEMGYSRRRI